MPSPWPSARRWSGSTFNWMAPRCFGLLSPPHPHAQSSAKQSPHPSLCACVLIIQHQTNNDNDIFAQRLALRICSTERAVPSCVTNAFKFLIHKPFQHLRRASLVFEDKTPLSSPASTTTPEQVTVKNDAVAARAAKFVQYLPRHHRCVWFRKTGSIAHSLSKRCPCSTVREQGDASVVVQSCTELILHLGRDLRSPVGC